MKRVIIGIIFTIGTLGVFLSGCGENKIYTEKDVYQKEGQWYEFSEPLDGETRWQYQRHRRCASRDQLYWRSEQGREYRIPNVAKRFKPVAV